MTLVANLLLFSSIVVAVAPGVYYAGFLHGRIEGRVEGYAEALKDEEEANNLD